jgi:hypothetical protein
VGQGVGHDISAADKIGRESGHKRSRDYTGKLNRTGTPFFARYCFVSSIVYSP